MTLLPPSAVRVRDLNTVVRDRFREHKVAQNEGSSSMQGNRELTGLTVRGSIVDFALLIGGAFATACAVAVVAVGVVLLLAR